MNTLNLFRKWNVFSLLLILCMAQLLDNQVYADSSVEVTSVEVVVSPSVSVTTKACKPGQGEYKITFDTAGRMIRGVLTAEDLVDKKVVEAVDRGDFAGYAFYVDQCDLGRYAKFDLLVDFEHQEDGKDFHTAWCSELKEACSNIAFQMIGPDRKTYVKGKLGSLEIKEVEDVEKKKRKLIWIELVSIDSCIRGQIFLLDLNADGRMIRGYITGTGLTKAPVKKATKYGDFVKLVLEVDQCDLSKLAKFDLLIDHGFSEAWCSEVKEACQGVEYTVTDPDGNERMKGNVETLSIVEVKDRDGASRKLLSLGKEKSKP